MSPKWPTLAKRPHTTNRGSRLLLSLGLLLTVMTACLPLFAQDARKQEEKFDYYTKWLEEDVLYIVTREELDVFSKLQTDDEKENFIEQFWRRRDTDPNTAFNEYKEEHYRRIAYSNEHFQSGIPGWKSDRGLIYIKYGPPDRMHTKPTGGYYERPHWEGGGTTNTYAYEVWEYRHLDEVGDDIEIEFVDPTLTGEYKLTTNRHEKDALLTSSTMGLTQAEMWGLVDEKIDRIVQKSNPGSRNNPLMHGYGRLKDQPFQKLETLANLQRAPAIDYTDLKADVYSEVFFDHIPLQVRSDVFRATAEEGRAIITVYVRNSDLTFVRNESMYESKIEVFALVKDLSGRIIKEIGDSLVAQIPAVSYDAEKNETLVYQTEVWLEPGRYKLEFFVKDPAAETLGSNRSLILVPPHKEDLEISNVMLARRFQVEGSDSLGRERLKIWPLHEKEGISTETGRIAFYFEVYNFGIDQSSGQPDIDIDYNVYDGDGKPVGLSLETSSVDVGADKAQILVALKGRDLKPGKHRLEIDVVDKVSGSKTQEPATFQLQ